jgi:hypothetical protein
LIAQIFVYGHSLENYLIAVIAVDPDMLKKWCEPVNDSKKVISDARNYAQVSSDPNDCEDLKTAIQEGLDSLVKKNKLNSLEKVKKFHLTMNPFTIEDGILTPSFKLKRFNAKQFFQPILDKMYASGDPAAASAPKKQQDKPTSGPVVEPAPIQVAVQNTDPPMEEEEEVKNVAIQQTNQPEGSALRDDDEKATNAFENGGPKEN